VPAKPRVEPAPKPQAKPAPPKVAKPAPPPPQPEPEPAPPEPPQQDEFAALLRSVEDMDRQREGEVVKEGTGRSREGAGRARTELGEARLSIGEIDALMRQIGRCWTLPVGIDGVEDMVVQLRIQVRPDRTVYGVTIEDEARLNRDPKFRAVAESARRAVDACSPLNLPPNKYAVWRDIIMNFHPEHAISG
jgi:type IV secretory pathway VirB10-like protein